VGGLVRGLALVALVLAALQAKNADAIPITFGFRGEITGLQDSSSVLDWHAGIGDFIEGTYTFDSAAPGRNGFFNSSITGFQARIGDDMLVPVALGGINNIEATDRTLQDTYYVRATVTNTPASSFGGVPIQLAQFVLRLVDPTAQVYFGNPPTPPAVPPDLALFADQAMELLILDRQGTFGALSLSAKPTSLYLVPEPSTGCLLALGLVALAAQARGRRAL
jgi:hypothetical protein